MGNELFGMQSNFGALENIPQNRWEVLIPCLKIFTKGFESVKMYHPFVGLISSGRLSVIYSFELVELSCSYSTSRSSVITARARSLFAGSQSGKTSKKIAIENCGQLWTPWCVTFTSDKWRCHRHHTAIKSDVINFHVISDVTPSSTSSHVLTPRLTFMSSSTSGLMSLNQQY